MKKSKKSARRKAHTSERIYYGMFFCFMCTMHVSENRPKEVKHFFWAKNIFSESDLLFSGLTWTGVILWRGSQRNLFLFAEKIFYLKDHANTRKLRRALKVWLDFSCSISRFVCAGVLLSIWKTFLHRPRFRQAISLGKNCFGIPCVFRKYVTPSLPFRKVEVKIARTEWYATCQRMADDFDSSACFLFKSILICLSLHSTRQSLWYSLGAISSFALVLSEQSSFHFTGIRSTPLFPKSARTLILKILL